jgi:predicted anti-sigma-YlaC factor YlaD
MMKCHSVQKKFSAYQDKELKPQEQEEVSSHLLSCRSCREQYVELEKIWQTLGEMEEIRPDPWFYRQVLGKIQKPRKQGLLSTFQHVFQLLRAPAIASVIILAVGIMAGIYLGNVMVRSDFLPFGQPTAVYSQEETLLDSLKVFDSAPPGTLAHGYLQMVSYKEHESR